METFWTQNENLSAPHIYLLGLLELGNTVDGVSIANKVISEMPFSNLPTGFNAFWTWKKRRCHGCMEPILDGGKAISCINLVHTTNPCTNAYCQNCIISFVDSKNAFSHDNKNHKTPQEEKKYRHKLWL